MPPTKNSKRNQAGPTGSTGTTRFKRKRTEGRDETFQAVEICVQEHNPSLQVAEKQMLGQVLQEPGPPQSHNVPG